jgi:hypothetical protein
MEITMISLRTERKAPNSHLARRLMDYRHGVCARARPSPPTDLTNSIPERCHDLRFGASPALPPSSATALPGVSLPPALQRSDVIDHVSPDRLPLMTESQGMDAVP